VRNILIAPREREFIHPFQCVVGNKRVTMNTLELGHQLKAETSLQASAIAQLRQSLRGELVLSDDASYEQARRVWNGMVDKRPLAIVYCSGCEDVVQAVHFAQAQGAPIAVRSGGHNVAGLSVCDGGVVIDLSRMKVIEVDRERRIARAEAGLSLGEFDTATQAWGLGGRQQRYRNSRTDRWRRIRQARPQIRAHL
jgi:hypothetical protein